MTDYTRKSRKADNTRFVRSALLIAPADDTYHLINIPKYAFVSEVWLYKLVAGTVVGCTISVGFVGNGETADPDGFIDTTLGDGDAAGVIKASGDTQPASQGKWFSDASGNITLTCVDDIGVSATMFVATSYVVIH